VELIVALIISIVVIALSGGILIFNSNMLAHNQGNADDQTIAERVADFAKDRLLYADSITVVTGGAVTADTAVSASALYIGAPSEAGEPGAGAIPQPVAGPGQLYYIRAGDNAAVNVTADRSYRNRLITLDYIVVVDEDDPKFKTFEIIATVYKGTQKHYTAKRKFRLINATDVSEPLSSVTVSGADTAYFLQITGNDQ
jgi:hypothetical protein